MGRKARSTLLRSLTLALSALSLALCACILLPAPNLTFVPLTVAAAELSPSLILFNLLISTLALFCCKRALAFTLAALLLSCWPLVQLPGVLFKTTAAGSLQLQPSFSVPSVLAECFRIKPRTSIRAIQLPLNILYYPPSTSSALHPAFIDLYGGGWQHGNPNQMPVFHSHMALLGFAVFALDYRHAPAYRFPAQLQDVNAALSFLAEHAAGYHLDPQRFVLCGHSSGAQLALLAAYRPGRPVPIRAVISYYGPTDLTRGYYDLPFPDPINVRAVLETYLGGPPSRVPDVYRSASPVTYAKAALPPTLLIQGKRDDIVKAVFARELYQLLLQSGDQAYLLEIPWSQHGFDLVSSGLGTQVSLRYLDAFLLRTVGN